MTTRYVSSVSRRAVVSSVNYEDGVINTRWLDSDSVGPVLPIPHPFGNKGGSGIFVGIKVGTVVVLVMGAYNDYIPVAVLPTNAYYDSDAAGVSEIDYDEQSFPILAAGEIVLQGPTGAQIRLNNSDQVEEIIIDNEFGEGIIIGGGNDSFRCSMRLGSPVNYVVSPHGIKASGIVRRDVKIENTEESFVDFLTGLDSEQSLEEIGWDPSRQVVYLSGGLGESIKGQGGGKIYRNPAYVEDRQIIYEFGRDYLVGTYKEEKERLESVVPPPVDSENRSERRSNVLGLSLANPNELMEVISGTVIDIFGNPIDLNRKILEPPKGDDAKKILEDTLEKARHTITYHIEINTRKGFRFDHKKQGTKKPSLFRDYRESINIVANNARDRSRWSIDVDKEGLTKINIPASSETGNVPLLTRYENSSVLDIDSKGNPTTDPRKETDMKKLFRNEENRDVFTEQFGPGGIKIKGDVPDNRMKGKKTSWVDSNGNSKAQKTMGATVEAGTAFHDITQTAWALIKDNINKTASDVFFNGPTSTESGLRAVSQEVNSEVPKDDVTPATRSSDKSGLLKDQPNAGGRSVHMNLDGNLEMSVGANTIDRVSWVLDTAGAIVWRLGRDRSGRSALIHADGTVALEVGGFDYVGESSSDEVDTRFVGRGEARQQVLELDPYQFRSGKVVIRVRRAKQDSSGPESDDTLLIIDETGVTITTPGRMDFISGQNMTLTSKSLITLEAPKVQIYRDNPKYFARTARLIR